MAMHLAACFCTAPRKLLFCSDVVFTPQTGSQQREHKCATSQQFSSTATVSTRQWECTPCWQVNKLNFFLVCALAPWIHGNWTQLIVYSKALALFSVGICLTRSLLLLCTSIMVQVHAVICLCNIRVSRSRKMSNVVVPL